MPPKWQNTRQLRVVWLDTALTLRVWSWVRPEDPETKMQQNTQQQTLKIQVAKRQSQLQRFKLQNDKLNCNIIIWAKKKTNIINKINMATCSKNSWILTQNQINNINISTCSESSCIMHTMRIRNSNALTNYHWDVAAARSAVILQFCCCYLA